MTLSCIVCQLVGVFSRDKQIIQSSNHQNTESPMKLLINLFAIFVSSVIAQTADPNTNIPTGISQACKNVLTQNLAGLEYCGAYFGDAIAAAFINGSIPAAFPMGADLSIPSLDSFCSRNCSNALNAMVNSFTYSFECENVPSPFESIPSKYELTATLTVLKEATCAKDYSKYCASTFFSVFFRESEIIESTGQSTDLICSTCVIREIQLLEMGVNTLSAESRVAVGLKVGAVSQLRSNCPMLSVIHSSTHTTTPRSSDSRIMSH